MLRSGERGTTLIEVMIAGVLLLVALLGFAGMASTSAASTGVAYRRGTAAYAQAGLLDRYLVGTRLTYVQIPPNTWILDNCYDVTGQVIASNNTLPPSTTFTCPIPPTYYRTWVNLQGTGPWVLSVYSERVDPGCDPTTRFSSLACVGADLYLSD